MNKKGIGMPLKRLNYTWDYCKTNPIGFAIIAILLFLINYLNQNAIYYRMRYQLLFLSSALIITIFIYGYGMVITKDIIRNGKKLPKIFLKECFVYGIKSFVITAIYSTIQSFILLYIAKRFYFPQFELKDAMVNIPETLQMFFVNEPVSTFEFILISIIATYITIFFMEISLARLADGGKILDSFNIPAIKRCIDIIGWRNYTIDYTKLLLAMAILAYLQYGTNYFGSYDYILNTILGLFIFVIQYIGIGKIYREYKIKKYSNLERPVRKVESE